MRKGAVTLLEKPFDDAALNAALDCAFTEGNRPASPTAEAASVDDEQAQAHARFQAREATLTPRERQVLGFVVQGVYNKNIADRIGLSIKTVELYRARGMAKMQARSVAELTRMMVSRQA
jgi:two-component system response regulator FixJ